MARRMNDTPKIVVSTTLTAPSWHGTTTVSSVDDLDRQRRESGSSMLVLGSPSLVGSLIDAALLDELRIMVNPVAIGAGGVFADAVTQHFDVRCETCGGSGRTTSCSPTPPADARASVRISTHQPIWIPGPARSTEPAPGVGGFLATPGQHERSDEARIALERWRWSFTTRDVMALTANCPGNCTVPVCTLEETVGRCAVRERALLAGEEQVDGFVDASLACVGVRGARDVADVVALQAVGQSVEERSGAPVGIECGGEVVGEIHARQRPDRTSRHLGDDRSTSHYPTIRATRSPQRRWSGPVRGPDRLRRVLDHGRRYRAPQPGG
jgi:hypothetical protein